MRQPSLNAATLKCLYFSIIKDSSKATAKLIIGFLEKGLDACRIVCSSKSYYYTIYYVLYCMHAQHSLNLWVRIFDVCLVLYKKVLEVTKLEF